MSESIAKVEKLNEVFTKLKKKESTGKISKAERALGVLIGAIDNVQQCDFIYKALQRSGYL